MKKISSWFEGIIWRNHLIELITVVIGITIAFGLNNWNEDRKDRQMEREYLQSIVADLENDIENMGGVIDTSSHLSSQTLKLIRLVKSGENLEDSLSVYLIGAYSYAYFLPTTNTYEALQGSGNFSLIRNFELRQKIIAQYNQHFGSVKEYDQVYRDFLQNQFMPRLFKEVDFSIFPMLESTDFIQEKEIINLIYSAYYYQSTRVTMYKAAREHALELLENLKSYL